MAQCSASREEDDVIKGGKGEQLKLFMTPDELKSYANPWDKQDIETVEGMWARKERESMKPEHWSYPGGGTYDSIASKGVTSHVEVWHDDDPDGPGLTDGHHRTAAAAAVERNLGKQQFIPLEHVGPSDNVNEPYVQHLFSYKRRYPQNVDESWGNRA
jgi:hypothetical protein